MQHLIKKNRWECLLYSFAMALDTTPAFLVKLLGHDGSVIIDPNAKEPHGRNGFHVQEFIPLVLALGRNCTPLQALPQSNINGRDYPVFEGVQKRCQMIAKLLHEEKGVMITGKHAVAFSVGWVFDPDGGEPFLLPDHDKVEKIFNTLSARRLPLQEVWVIR